MMPQEKMVVPTISCRTKTLDSSFSDSMRTAVRSAQVATVACRLPAANLKWAKRKEALTKFTSHDAPIPNTTAGRRKLQNHLIDLKKRHTAEGAAFLHRLRIMPEKIH